MSTIVSISEGKLQGSVIENIRGDQIYSFQGIPYAKPPVGNLRFKAPQPVEPWQGILDATKDGNPSPQRHVFNKTIIGSEDCLNLSVYTPDILNKNRSKTQFKPVMVFIHGGAFTEGSNKSEIYGPEFLLTEDIVLVVINYRLGILGFLALDDSSLGVPGNAAFKDMVLALKWVQRNIKNFMGDPNNVTIFGESAGAAAVHLLMLSPMAQGLFHKAIAQSGCALNGWVYGTRIASDLAKEMGCGNKSDKDILAFLQNASVEDIIKGQTMLANKSILANQSRYVGVVVEKSSNEPAFFNTHPENILLSGNYKKIPFMLGYNNAEGLLFDVLVPKEKRKIYFEDGEIHVPGLLHLERGSPVSKLVGNQIVREYLSGETDEIRQKQLYELTTHNCFVYGIFCTIRHHLRFSNTPIYLYRMSIESQLNIYKQFNGINKPGVCHGDDLGYLFKTLFTPDIIPDSIEDIAQKRFVKMWTNFARYGHPVFKKDPLLNIRWKPVKKDAVHYLDIGENLEMKCDPEITKMKFWDEIFKNKKPVSKL